MKRMGVEGKRASRSDSDDEVFPHTPHVVFPKLFELEHRREFRSCGSLSSENEGSAWDTEIENINKHGDFSSFRRQPSIVDGLLFEIYDRWHGSCRDSFDSDTFTECSSTSEVFHTRWDSLHSPFERRNVRQFHRAFLENQSLSQLQKMVGDLQRSINQSSVRLVRQLKRRDRRLAKLHKNCDVVTAILQASSLKRRIDTRMRFSIEPSEGESAFEQWKDAMKAVARLPLGIPYEFRKKVWLSLADNHIKELKIDWEKTVRFAFNERSNPDDDKLGLQIVKDLHRTGCSSFSGQDNEEDRAVLKRVLLAYARWNKQVGYCQGFNVIAALLLDVMDRKEDDALMVMIYLVDHVLPESYFSNNLRALSVDMAVFRDLLRLTFPALSKHLDHLQNAAQDQSTGACYEPPLTNVFTMQWFLTLFATCLPKSIVLRVWDSILLEGSEILLRTALTIWGKLARRIMSVWSADEFYTLMGDLSADMMAGRVFDGDAVIKSIYCVSPFPFPQLNELREKYTYNIRPFTNTSSSSKKTSRMAKNVLYSDEDELDEEDMEAITCFPGFVPLQGMKARGADGEMGSGYVADISVLGPGAYGAMSVGQGMGPPPVYLERMSTDISGLKKQYERLRQRQRQAHIILAAATARQTPKPKATALVPKIESPLAMNHLFVGKQAICVGSRNRLVAEGPRIMPIFPRNSHLNKQLQAVAEASRRRGRDRRESGPGYAKCPIRQTDIHATEDGFNRDGDSHCDVAEEGHDTDTSVADQKVHSPCDTNQESSHVVVNDCSNTDVNDHGRDSYSGLPGHGLDYHRDAGDHNGSSLAVSDMGSDSDAGSLEGDSHASVNDQRGASDVNVSELGGDRIGCASDEVCPVTVQHEEEEESSDRLSDESEEAVSNVNNNNKEDGPSSYQCNKSANGDQLQNRKSDLLFTKPDKALTLNIPHRTNSSKSESDATSQRHVELATQFVYVASRQHSNRNKSRASSGSSLSSTPTTPDFQGSSPTKSKPFNPFPVKHINQNRAKNGLKLGLYTSSTLQQIGGPVKRGSSGNCSKPKTGCS